MMEQLDVPFYGYHSINKNNNNLRIQYFAGMDNKNVNYYQDLLGGIKLMIN